MRLLSRFTFNSIAICAGCLAATLACPQGVFAQTFPTYLVNSEADAPDDKPGNGVCAAASGLCTLRAAIEENQASGTWGVVVLPAGNFVLTTGPLVITGSVSIQGKDNQATVIDANQHRGFEITTAAPLNLFLSNLALHNGLVQPMSGDGMGAGILNLDPSANVSLFRVRLFGNQVNWVGGGIYSVGYLNIEESAIEFNSAPKSDGSGNTGKGGGINNQGGGTLVITRSTIHGNAGTQGAGIYNAGTLRMTNSTVVGNLASYRGGGLFNDNNTLDSSTASISYSTFTKNETNSPNNTGRQPDGLKLGGGGIWNAGRLFIGNTIVAGNVDPRGFSVPGFSPDIWALPYPSSVFNPVTGKFDPITFTPTTTSFRNNIIGAFNPSTCNMHDESADPLADITGTDRDPLDPMLNSVDQNGGVGQTMQPLPGSPALDNVHFGTSATFFDCPATDERGVTRPPQDGSTTQRCDIGAYEQAPSTGAVEAESSEITGLTVSNDAAASGGKYVASANGSGNRTAAPDAAHRMRFTFYVDQGSSYNIRGTVRASAPDHNSFWVRVDDIDAQTYLWDLANSSNQFVTDLVSNRGAGTEQRPALDPVNPFLSRGLHTVDVYLREDGSQLDKLELVASTAQAPLEAEASAMSGFFMMGFDPLASGGRYLFAPTKNFLDAPDDNNKVTTVVDVATAGTYLIKANVRAVRDDHNSFWVKVDGLPANGYLWDMTEDNLTYGDDYVSDRGAGDSANPDVDPVELNLTAGPHTIEVFAREAGTRLDRIGFESKAVADARIVSRSKPTFSSSNESNSFLPGNAVDGNTATRWSSQAADNQWIKVDLQATYDIDRVVLNWESAYATSYEIQISDDAESWTPLFHKEGNTGGIDNIMLAGRGRYVRMFGLHRATPWGFSLREFTVYGAPATGGDVNLCAGKPVTTSSNQDASTVGAKAVDQNTSTRWSSNFSDDQWIYVDLGVSQPLTRVKLRWEAAYGKSFEIRVSDDAANWTTLFSTTNGNGGLDDISVSGKGRYVKMKGLQRGTQFGYSLFEFEAYGK